MRPLISFFFFFNDTATTEIYTLSLHDALPICRFAERPEVVPLQEHRVRIVQLVEHPSDRHLIQPALVDRIDVIVGHVGEHVLEQAPLLVPRPDGRGLPLQQPAARGQRHAGDGDEDQRLPELHETPRVESGAAARTSRHAASRTACFDCVPSTWTTPGPCARRYASSTRR